MQRIVAASGKSLWCSDHSSIRTRATAGCRPMSGSSTRSMLQYANVKYTTLVNIFTSSRLAW
jgi:hypothetical protein